MKNKKYGWLLIGILAGMILGRLTIPDTVWGAELSDTVLCVASGTTVIDDISDPDMFEIQKAVEYLSENAVVIPPEIESLCKKYGKENGIVPELIEAIIWKESRFQPDAVNASGSCHGLMQVHKGSHRARMDRLNVTDLYDSEQNIKAGTDYLRELFEKYEDTATVLEYYNGDSAAAADLDRDSGYARKVMNISTALERAHWK